MLKHRIAQILEKAAIEAQEKGLLPPVALPETTVEHPQNPQHGDYASTLPLKLAKAGSLAPLAIAQTLAKLLPQIEEVERISVAAPGFINFVLSSKWLTQQVQEILDVGEEYGNLDLGNGATARNYDETYEHSLSIDRRLRLDKCRACG